MLTADTHFTDGYLDKSCDTIFSEAYANSFYCSDSMIAEFISWIQEQDFYENTTIVLTGDHPTMQENFYNIDNNYDRVVYNAFVNSRVLPVNNKLRCSVLSKLLINLSQIFLINLIFSLGEISELYFCLFISSE